MLAGWLYDLGGNYTIFLIAGVIGSVISGILLLTLPRYSSLEREPRVA